MTEPDAIWSTVDVLIHDLGAIRAFIDEVDAVPEVAEAQEVADVRGAMNVATEAISHLLTDTQAPALEAARTAIARAQDAVAKARRFVASAQQGRAAAERMREVNRAQAERVMDQRHAIADQGDRLRANPPGGG
jgi:hypothetical protein